jgi:quercetin dioxygenase-like cupin family protein
MTPMKRRFLLSILGVVAALAVAGTALATGAITVKGIGAFAVTDSVGYPAGHTFTAQMPPGSVVNSVTLRVPPGGAFPWHYHTSALTVTVTHGSVSVQDATSCARQTFTTGQGFVEEPGVIHRAANQSGTLAVLVVTYLGVPSGQPGDIFEPPTYDPCP